MDMQNAVAFVTGSAKRVGREVALSLARKGVHVVIHYNQSVQDADKTVHDAEALGVRAIAVQGDVSKPDDVGRMFQNIQKTFASLDILVTCAAVFRETPFESITEEDWDYHYNTNVKGTFFCCQQAGIIMQRQQRGKIITIGDWAGEKPYTGYIPYCASKAGVINMTKNLAKALAPHIQVNCINPGPVMLPPDFSETDKQKIIAKTPLQRIGSPRDIANTVLFLVEGSDFLTGSVITVDGGRIIYEKNVERILYVHGSQGNTILLRTSVAGI
jgi:NAD(P)-dependent dehydrogenase (short-subunit alcohol dehydrogenase family)